jgi:hypothetical protein
MSDDPSVQELDGKGSLDDERNRAFGTEETS